LSAFSNAAKSAERLKLGATKAFKPFFQTVPRDAELFLRLARIEELTFSSFELLRRGPGDSRINV
jgi:hypothetical protein